MDLETFKSELIRDGYTEIETRTMPAGQVVDDHIHPFDVRALVLEGEVVIGCNGDQTTYRPGDVLTMPSNTHHTEAYGFDQDYRFLVGRRYQG